MLQAALLYLVLRPGSPPDICSYMQSSAFPRMSQYPGIDSKNLQHTLVSYFRGLPGARTDLLLDASTSSEKILDKRADDSPIAVLRSRCKSPYLLDWRSCILLSTCGEYGACYTVLCGLREHLWYTYDDQFYMPSTTSHVQHRIMFQVLSHHPQTNLDQRTAVGYYHSLV